MHSQCRGEGGAAPFKKYDVILRARSQAAWRPKDLVPTELFLGRRGAGTMESAANQKTKLYHQNVITMDEKTYYVYIEANKRNRVFMWV